MRELSLLYHEQRTNRHQTNNKMSFSEFSYFFTQTFYCLIYYHYAYQVYIDFFCFQWEAQLRQFALSISSTPSSDRIILPAPVPVNPTQFMVPPFMIPFVPQVEHKIFIKK